MVVARCPITILVHSFEKSCRSCGLSPPRNAIVSQGEISAGLRPFPSALTQAQQRLLKMLGTTNAEAAQHPWLEYFPEGGDRVKSTKLDKDQFTIGRADTADIQIDSARVSREHARIIRKGSAYLIRDLQSTNGTFVNAKRIEEAVLKAGDVIMVADTEFAFLMDSVNRLRRMKTQQMPSNPRRSCPEESVQRFRPTQEAVLSLRTAHERLRQRFTPIELATVSESAAGEPFAHLEHFVNSQGISAKARSPLLQPPSHVLIRQREIHRMETVRRCLAGLSAARIIVPLAPWEIHEVSTLVWHFEALAARLPRAVTLLASVPASDAADLKEVQKFCSDLRNMGIEACCHDFVGSHVHVEHLAELGPQLLLLSSEMSATFNDTPQKHERLVAVAKSCRNFGIRPVVTAKHNSESIKELSELGIDLFLTADSAPAFDSSVPDLAKEVPAAV